MKSLLIINGPNLNLLGQRQPEVYGKTTLDQVEKLCQAKAKSCGCTITFEQSNHEGVLVDLIQDAKGKFDAIILNAGAYTHTSVALMDAISSVQVPVCELHLSNIHAREEFRQKSYIAPVAVGQICGFGPAGYALAIEAMLSHLDKDMADA